VPRSRRLHPLHFFGGGGADKVARRHGVAPGARAHALVHIHLHTLPRQTDTQMHVHTHADTNARTHAHPDAPVCPSHPPCVSNLIAGGEMFGAAFEFAHLRYALVSKETYIRGKRDLVHSQKRPTIIGIPEVRTNVLLRTKRTLLRKAKPIIVFF
jgi:hypothetical protein